MSDAAANSRRSSRIAAQPKKEEAPAKAVRKPSKKRSADVATGDVEAKAIEEESTAPVAKKVSNSELYLVWNLRSVLVCLLYRT